MYVISPKNALRIEPNQTEEEKYGVKQGSKTKSLTETKM